MLPKTEGKPGDVDQQVELEDAEEKLPERVKHLDEKVPPETDVGGQVGEEKVDAVGRGEEGPGGGSDEVGECEEGEDGGEEDSGLSSGEFLARFSNEMSPGGYRNVQQWKRSCRGFVEEQSRSLGG